MSNHVLRVGCRLVNDGIELISLLRFAAVVESDGEHNDEQAREADHNPEPHKISVR